MTKERCLFIGGPADGQRREVIRGQERVEIVELPRFDSFKLPPVRPIDATEKIRSNIYRAEPVRRGSWPETIVYVLDGAEGAAEFQRWLQNQSNPL